MDLITQVAALLGAILGAIIGWIIAVKRQEYDASYVLHLIVGGVVSGIVCMIFPWFIIFIVIIGGILIYKSLYQGFLEPPPPEPPRIVTDEIVQGTKVYIDMVDGSSESGTLVRIDNNGILIDESFKQVFIPNSNIKKITKY